MGSPASMPGPGLTAHAAPTTQSASSSPGPTGNSSALAAMPYRPLNVRDALSYLDEVKVQFNAQPEHIVEASKEVYNRFLDIMKDFKTQIIDTPGVIDRVSSLFRLHPALIQGFNTFLPPGYRIDFYCPYGGDPAGGTIYVTTPLGTTASKPGQGTNLTGRFPADSTDIKQDFLQKIRDRLGEEATKRATDVLSQSQNDQSSYDVFTNMQTILGSAPDLLAELRVVVAEIPAHSKAATKSRLNPLIQQSPTGKGNAAVPLVAEEPPLKKKRTSMLNLSMGSGLSSGASEYIQSPFDESHRGTLPVAAPSKRPVESSARLEVGPATHTSGTGQQVVASVGQPYAREGSHLPKPRAEYVELTFFDRIARYIDDRTTYHEFLKLCNLFTQDIINLPALIERASLFIGGSKELWAQFCDYVRWRDGSEGRKIDEAGVWLLSNVPVLSPTVPTGEQYGPSYRKLPDSELLLACSGRDQLCWDVLNDQWVSSPTWASEEGFLATKKNQYEEALIRCEEDRFEYDYHIDAVQRTIALLEPLAARIAAMSPEERSSFRLKPGLGGQSKSIYPAVYVAVYEAVISSDLEGRLKKIYGQDVGLEIIQALHDNPCIAVPIVLARIKQKEDEWRRALRDWKPIWRDIDTKNHYKALDYQAIQMKTFDKKSLLSKWLVSEIETIRRKQQQNALSQQISRGRADDATSTPRFQLSYHMPNQGVLFDALRLVLAHLDRSPAYTETEKDQVERLLRNLVQHVFAIAASDVNAALQPLPEIAIAPLDTIDAESDGIATDLEGATISAAESSSGRGGRRRQNKNALLKQAIDRTTRRRGSKNGTATGPMLSDSEMPVNELPVIESNPLAADDHERPVPADASGLDAMEGVETLPRRIPSPALSASSTAEGSDVGHGIGDSETPLCEDAVKDALLPASRRLNFFCGSSLYAAMRIIRLLHSRLLAIKLASSKVQNHPTQFAVLRSSADLSPYESCLDHCQRFFSGDIDAAAFEDAIRATMGTAGFPIYNVDKVVAGLIRQLHFALDPNGAEEEKAEHVIDLLMVHRNRGSTARSEIAYRQSVEAALGGLGENVYRIEWVRATSTMTFQILGKDEVDEDDEEAAFETWQQYIISFVGHERTEGLGTKPIDGPMLKRHLALVPRVMLADVKACSGLGIKFCMRSLKIFYQPGSEEWLCRAAPYYYGQAAKERQARQARFQSWLERRIQDVPM